MKQALSILIGYLTCEDPTVKTKWANLLASFWHKDEGKIVTGITTAPNGDVTIEIKDGDGNSESTTIPKVQLPTSHDISFINGLQDALNDKVDKVPGKGLSANDFTTALKQKLEALQNYVHPPTHSIAEVSGLQTALDGIPTKTSELQNDGESGTPFLTEVDEKIVLQQQGPASTNNNNAIRFTPKDAILYSNFSNSELKPVLILPKDAIAEGIWMEVAFYHSHQGGEIYHEFHITAGITHNLITSAYEWHNVGARIFSYADWEVVFGTHNGKHAIQFKSEGNLSYGTGWLVVKKIALWNGQFPASISTWKEGWSGATLKPTDFSATKTIAGNHYKGLIEVKDHLGNYKFGGTHLSFGDDFDFDTVNKRINLKATFNNLQNGVTNRLAPTKASKKFQHSGTANVGAIAIKLPTWVNDFVDITISTQGYSGNIGYDFRIKAFNRDDGNFLRWEQVTVFKPTKSEDQTYTPSIRLGNDGTNAFIYLGELTDNWMHSYAVTIKEIVVGGYGAFSVSASIINSLLNDSWDIALESTGFATIDYSKQF